MPLHCMTHTAAIMDEEQGCINIVYKSATHNLVVFAKKKLIEPKGQLLFAASL